MSHASRFSIAGHFDVASIALARAARNAGLAAEHRTPLPHEDVLFDAAVAAAKAFLAVVDPTSVGVDVDVNVETGCSDDANLTPYVHLSKSWRLPSASTDMHSWGMTAIAPLTTAEQALMTTNLAAGLAAKGRTVEAGDTTVQAGFVAAIATWLAAVAPSATGVSVRVDASVGNGSLGRVSASLGIVVPSSSVGPAPDPLAGVLTPPPLTVLVNNYNPAGLATATVLRLSTVANVNITGLAGGSSTRMLMLYNIGASPFNLRANDTGSLAANRFLMASTVTLGAGDGCILMYDPVALGWRVVGVHL